MPKLQWKHHDEGGKLGLTVQVNSSPRGARLWLADSATRDFRKATWTSQPAELIKGKVTCAIDPPPTGYRAFYAELDFEVGGLTYHLSTQLRVAGPEKRK